MKNTKHLIITALCMALGVVLPMAFHMIPNAGSVMLPMHIPVLLCGLVCGPVLGLICGILTPILSSLITGMPGPAYLPSMICELAVYGLLAGVMIKLIKTEKPLVNLYASLITAMIGGRIVYGLMNALDFQSRDIFDSDVADGVVRHGAAGDYPAAAASAGRRLRAAEGETGVSELNKILLWHAGEYSAMQSQDAVKLIYQNEFGCEHLIEDPSGMLAYLKQEITENAQRKVERCWDEIGNGLVRLHLAGLKEHDAEAILDAMRQTAAQHSGSEDSFRRN